MAVIRSIRGGSAGLNEEDRLKIANLLVKAGYSVKIGYREIPGNTKGKKELNKACTKIKEMTLDTMLTLSVATLHDEFDFGAKRCQRFMKRMNLKAECIVDDLTTWDDFVEQIREELGLEITIRRND